MCPIATVTRIYGYYLGNPDDGWHVEEANSRGSLNLGWYVDVNSKGTYGDFIASATDHLHDKGALADVAFVTFGDLTPGSSRVHIALAAEGSRSSTSQWGDSLSLEAGSTLTLEPHWDLALTRALRAMGLTPHQERACWQYLPALH